LQPTAASASAIASIRAAEKVEGVGCIDYLRRRRRLIAADAIVATTIMSEGVSVPDVGTAQPRHPVGGGDFAGAASSVFVEGGGVEGGGLMVAVVTVFDEPEGVVDVVGPSGAQSPPGCGLPLSSTEGTTCVPGGQLGMAHAEELKAIAAAAERTATRACIASAYRVSGVVAIRDRGASEPHARSPAQ
jgi:hypothetical protein